MKKLVSAGALLLAAFFVALSGCSKKGEVIANIGKDSIDVNMLEERLRDAPPAYQSYLNTEAGRKQFLDLLVRERVVLEAARQDGLKNREEYKKALSEFKKDQARRVKDYEDSLLMELYVRELHGKEVGVTDQEVEEYYNEHKNEYQRPVEIVARHILVTTSEEADKVMERIKAKEDFAAIAKEVSVDPISAARGGEIGPFRKGDLVPEFEKAVFPLKAGEVSSIVKTQFGFHIIKKVSEKTLSAVSMDEAKLEIRKTLEKLKFDAWFERTKTRFGVNVNYDRVSRIPFTQEQENEVQPETEKQ